MNNIVDSRRMSDRKDHIKMISDDLTKCELSADKKYKTGAKPGTYQAVLSELLGQVKSVDFRKKAELEEDAKMARKFYVVIAIDEILNTASTNNWGLATKDGFIYVFNGKYWNPISAEDFKPFLAQAACKMGVPILESKYHQFKEELYKQFLSESNLQTPERKDSVLINLLNGTFEISSSNQGLRQHKRENFIKYQLTFEYDANTKCPLFEKYLNRVLPDEDCQKVLAEYLGYVFVNNLKLEKAVILYGSGANGKSVFFEIINALLGQENICSYSLQNLTKYDSYQRAELANKLLNYASEINGKLEASIFKQLVSGEPVEARQIYGKPFVMRDYGKLMFNCNELPKEVEQTNAFFRRFIIIPFTQTIPEAEQDSELAKKIINNELSGVFNWILDGLNRILSQKKFTQSVLVKAQIDAYRKESDSVAMFLDEEDYKPSIREYISLKFMYDEYRTYSIENGYKSCSVRTYSERLKTLGFDIVRKNQGRMVYTEKSQSTELSKNTPDQTIF